MESWWIMVDLFYLGLGSLLAACVAFFAFGHRTNSLAITLGAFASPYLCAALWLTGCYSAQQIKSATGHKHGWAFNATFPLSGGYDLTYDRKFQSGAISKHRHGSNGATVNGVGAVQILPPLVAGQYTQDFGRLLPDQYFIFNTQTGTLQNISSEKELGARLGSRVRLLTLDDAYDAAP